MNAVVGVGDQEHVGLLDLLEPADRGAVEAEAVLERSLDRARPIGTEKCCIRPGRSQNRRSTISAPASEASCRTSSGVVVAMRVVLLPSSTIRTVREGARARNPQSVPSACRDAVTRPLTLGNESAGPVNVRRGSPGFVPAGQARCDKNGATVTCMHSGSIGLADGLAGW